MAKRILIVDDDREMVERKEKLLNSKGYEVKTAFNGKEGLKSLKKEQFDLLVLDLDMPKMRGDELLEILKEDPKSSSMKVLVITGMDEPHIFNKDDTWEYDHHPITKAQKLGPAQRGWHAGFNLVRKWHTMDWYTMSMRFKTERRGFKPPQPPDELTDRQFLTAVEEMFIEPESVDRPRREDEAFRILIAEDDESLRENIRQRLSKHKNWQIITAKDGQEAIDILSRDPIDLLILDLEMPHARGDEVIEVLSSDFVLSMIPVIVYTGVKDWDKPDDESLRKKILDSGHPQAVYEKKKDSPIKRIFKLDAATDLIYRAEDLFLQRLKWGYGYIKGPLTFVKNKKDKWMHGALENYMPIDIYDFRYKEMKSYNCSLCCRDRQKGDDIIHCYEYNMAKIIPVRDLKYVHGESYLVCPDCVKELKEKYPGILGKYRLSQKKRRSKESIKAGIKKEPKAQMNDEIYQKVKSVIIEICYTAAREEIRPSDRLKEDIFKHPQLADYFMANICLELELNYDIEITDNDKDWFDTVQDIVDFVDDAVASKDKYPES
ncbi:MAG: response regulator [Candidatus Omnitrophota bacterium]